MKKFLWIVGCLIVTISFLLCYVFQEDLFDHLSIVDKEVDKVLTASPYDLIIVGAGTSGSLIAGKFFENFEKKRATIEQSMKKMRDSQSSQTSDTYRHPTDKLHSDEEHQQCSLHTHAHGHLGQPRVLIIEAGRLPTGLVRLLSDVPLLVPLLSKTEVNWNYKTTEQRHSNALMHDRKLIVPLGRVVGGSSMVNAMMANFGHPDDVNNWNVSGWKSSEAIKILEELTNENCECGLKYEKLAPHQATKDMQKTFFQIFKDANLTSSMSKTSVWSREGMFRPLSYTTNGVRASSFASCLEPLLKSTKPLIHLAHSSKVQQLNFEKGKRGHDVTGLNIVHRGKSYQVKLTQRVPLKRAWSMRPETVGKVVLSAGAFESAAILLRSGIGQQKTLQKHCNIEHRVELPIGLGLQDTPLMGTIGQMGNGTTLTSPGVIGIRDIFDYFVNRKGALAQASAMTNMGFLRTSLQKKQNKTQPDLELVAIGASPNINNIFKDASNLKDENWERILPIGGNKGSNFVLIMFLLTPESRGSVTLNSLNHRTLPDPNYFQSQADVDRVVEGVSWLHHVFNQSNLYVPAAPDRGFNFHGYHASSAAKMIRRFQIKLHLPEHDVCPPRPEQPDLSKWRSFYECLVRSQIFTGYHYMGSIRLGERDDDTKPVNPDLKLKKFSNLWIADASVIPKMVTGHPVGLISVVATKAARWIADELISSFQSTWPLLI